MNSSSQRYNRNAILKNIGIYIFFGVLWIYFSDTILAWLVRDANLMTYVPRYQRHSVYPDHGVSALCFHPHVCGSIDEDEPDASGEGDPAAQQRDHIPGVATSSLPRHRNLHVSYVSEKLTETFDCPRSSIPSSRRSPLTSWRRTAAASWILLREAVVPGPPGGSRAGLSGRTGNPSVPGNRHTERDGPSILYHGVPVGHYRAEESGRRPAAPEFRHRGARGKRPHHRPERVMPVRESGLRESPGYSRSETIGRTPSLLKSGVQEHSFYENLWKTLKSGVIWSGRIQPAEDGN